MVSMLIRKIQFLVFCLLVVWGGEKVGHLQQLGLYSVLIQRVMNMYAK